MYCLMLLGSKVHRTPGDRWMIHGPTDYIPRTEIGNIQRRLVFMYLQNYVYQFNVILMFCGLCLYRLFGVGWSMCSLMLEQLPYIM